MNKTVTLLAMLWLMLVNGAWAQTGTAPSSGDGSESNPYEIANLDNLYWLSQNNTEWSNYFIQTADIDAADTKNWDISGSDTLGFSPIGNGSTNFTGSYNGQGYYIDGLTINRPSTDYIGLFGYTSGATIDSLSLLSTTIVGSVSVGGLVGGNYSSSVSNCYATGTVSGVERVGGLVGFDSNSTVSNSYATGTVSGDDDIGGLVGVNYSSSTVSNSYSAASVFASNGGAGGGLVGTNHSATVSNSYSVGSVSGSIYVGGLVGDTTSSTVSNSYYNSELSGQTDTGNGEPLTTSQMKQSSSFSGWDFVDMWEITNGQTFPRVQDILDGPIILQNLSKVGKSNVAFNDTIQVVGMDNQSVSIELLQFPSGMVLVNDSILTWTPTVTGIDTVEIKATDANGLFNTYSFLMTVTNLIGEGSESNPYIISSLDDLKELSETSTIWDSYFIQTADIEAAETSAWNSAAGFSPIGNDTTQFMGSYNGQGHIIDGLSINRPSHDYVGMFGYVYGATIDSLGITSCFVSGDDRVGALVGQTTESSISNSYATGTVSGTDDVGGLVGYNYSYSTISNSYATGSVSGDDEIGGLVGLIYNHSTVSNCYATGSVSADSDKGGLVGEIFNYSTVSNSYYNSETSGQNDTGKGVALSTAQMKQSSSFVGWDFATTWGIITDSTYPSLLGMNNNAPFAFADTLNVAVSCSLLANDYDYETGQDFLTGKMVSISSKGFISNGAYSFNANEAVGAIETVTYCVGEIIAVGDTLWGNNAVAILTKIANTAPELTAVSNKTIDEDASITLSIADVTASDAENDVLSLAIISGDNYTFDSLTITPTADFNGTVTVPVYVNDGELNSDTLEMSIMVNAVNDAPVLSAVAANLATYEATPLTLSISDVTASDAEGDNLSLIINEGENYSVNGLTLTPASEFSGTLTVPVYVTDGELYSDTLNMSIIVNAAEITWEAPASLVYGAVNASSLMNAEADVAGTFSYSFTADSIFNAGTYQLQVDFTPSGSSYASATANIEITVTKASLTVTANDQVVHIDSVIPALSLSYSGFVNNDSENDLVVAPTATTTTNESSAAGTYSIAVAGGSDTNYEFTYVEGTLTIENEVSVSDLVDIEFNVYPNPASDVVNVTLPEGLTATIVLYNTNGAKLMQLETTANTTPINVAYLKKGVYMFDIMTDTKNEIIRWIKE